MRLTSEGIKQALSNKCICYGSRLVGKQFFAKMCNELIEYKYLEEELGIDLITLFKAQTNGFYVKTALGVFSIILSDWKFNLIKRRVQRTQFSSHYYFKDYGKTWALTKEELEDEKAN